MSATQGSATVANEPLGDRRGFFKRLPPLSMPSARRRGKTDAKSPVNRQDSISVVSPKSATKAVATVGSIAAKVGSNTTSQPQQNTLANSPGENKINGQTEHDRWPGFVPAKHCPCEDGQISPGTRPEGSILKKFSFSQCGVLPDVVPEAEKPSDDVPPFPHRDSIEMAHEKAASASDPRPEKTSENGLASEPKPTKALSEPTPAASSGKVVKATRPALKLITSFKRDKKTSDSSPPTATPSTVGSSFPQTALAANPDPNRQNLSGSTTANTNGTASNDWNPANPGHDTWRDISLFERRKLKTRMRSDMAAFTWTSALRRRKTPPEPSLSPRNSSHEPADVGNLLQNRNPLRAGSKTKTTSAPPVPQTRTTKPGSIVRDFAFTQPDLPSSSTQDPNLDHISLCTSPSPSPATTASSLPKLLPRPRTKTDSITLKSPKVLAASYEKYQMKNTKASSNTGNTRREIFQSGGAGENFEPIWKRSEEMGLECERGEGGKWKSKAKGRMRGETV